ncbi:hypothetical protein [Kitasatospora griseola]|uniref:hypothetical protein n=1 Tax=Kitasatospora griseola TaxID=2064 RepID=UPI00364FC02C
MAATRVRHIIEIRLSEHEQALYTVDFTSRDIGCTQGTTLTLGGRTIAQYQPGTRHWDTALETAEHLVAKAAERAVARNRFFDLFTFCTELTAVVAEDRHCTPWDGTP